MINSVNNSARLNALIDFAQSKQVNGQKEESVIISKNALDMAVEKLNEAMDYTRTKHRFIIDEDLDRPIVEIINSETNEVIRQIPTEEAVELSKHIGEMIGLLMDDTI